MKKRIAIYPYHKGIEALLKSNSHFREYDLKYLIVPQGWESFNEVEHLDKSLVCQELHFFLNKLIGSVDTLLLCEPFFQVEKSLYEEIITLAKEAGIHIMYTAGLKPVLKNTITNEWECLEFDNSFPVMERGTNARIDVPVIVILGMGENSGKWDLQLKLCEAFLNSGYKVSLISSNPLSRLWGHNIIPSFVDSKILTFAQQVENMNAFIKDVEIRERPDVIIIGVPGAILKYSPVVTNGYGYLPFLVCNAVQPDLTILSLYCGSYEEEHLKELKSACFYRYGVNVDYYNISDKVCLYNPETRDLDYHFVNQNFFLEANSYFGTGMHTFNTSEDRSREQAFKSIVSELQENIPAI